MPDLKLLNIDRVPAQGVKELLDNNVIGTPGKSMMYQHLQAAEKYTIITQPFFVSLVRRSKVIATCCFCKREASNRGVVGESYYVRYFTFHPSLRKLGDKYIERPQEDGVLRREIRSLLSGADFEAKAPHFFYAYIDGGNVRSEAFVKSFGFEKVGSFVSLVFSRFNPRLSKNIKKLSPDEWGDFKPMLLRFYSDHVLVTDENLFYKENYFVVREQGEIVAGIQANPENWRVHDMPGKAGKVMINVFPKVRLLSKIFHPNYRFVTIEGVYYRPGHEKKLATLLTHALAANGVYSAVICIDPTSRLYPVMQSLGLGLVSKLRKPKRVDVVVKSNGVDLATMKGPVYVSAFDVS
ncbi:hypothetical protein [uncultured Imperialibacter sp.]|uniref:hypothetical protein n=1 Tax=uncultured Imperialibacter sp. TaxID=1672639 RepID=UPI0030DA51E8|tara:strand:- start:46981 stop:48036 length:1056 start_codon:yes stop_codon:yes gene_type:complete